MPERFEPDTPLKASKNYMDVKHAATDALPKDVHFTLVEAVAVYEMNNGVFYVNRPRSGAESLNWTNVLVTDTHSSQLCSIDTVKLYDTGVRMTTGWVGLGDFVPYTKPPHS